MKCLLKLLVIGLLVVSLLVGGVIAMLNPMLAAAVEEGVGYATDQETHLEEVDVSLFAGEFGFQGLSIANPPGFQETPLLTISSFQTKLNLEQMTGELIELELVELEGLTLALQLVGSDSNVTALLTRLRELQGSTAETPVEEEPETDAAGAAGPEIRIQRIRISGVIASLAISGVPLANGVYKVQVPDILLENFSTEMQSATLVEWSAYIVETVLTAALAAGDGNFPSQWQGLLDGQLQLSRDELLEKAKSDPEGLMKDFEKGADDLKNLFGDKQ